MRTGAIQTGNVNDMGCVLYRNGLGMWCSGARRSHLTHTEDKRRRPEEVDVQRAERSSGWVPGRVSWREGSDETREIIMEGPQ